MDIPALSLIICTLDEADSIGPVLQEVGQVLSSVAHEIIVVDDSDGDETASVVRAFAVDDPRIRLIRRRSARGLAAAAIAGWSAARGTALAIMDGDGQHDPQHLPAMLDALWASDADVVVASRYTTSGPSGLGATRHIMSRFATLATQIGLGAPVSDPMSGFFVVRRTWFEAVQLQLSGVGFKILVDVMASGLRAPRTGEIATVLRTRIAGQSKLDMRVILELAALLLEKRTRGLLPSQFTLFACVGVTGIAINLAALWAFRHVGAGPFWVAQGFAIVVAMVWNFLLNNVLTFRERRLHGAAFAWGLAAFCLSCAGGAVLSDLIGTALHAMGSGWVAASVAGTLCAAMWNYWSARRSAWSSGQGEALLSTTAVPGLRLKNSIAKVVRPFGLTAG